jgi:hypothetical protein
MLCTHCLLIAPISRGLPHTARALWNEFARAWRAALGKLGQLG